MTNQNVQTKKKKKKKKKKKTTKKHANLKISSYLEAYFSTRQI